MRSESQAIRSGKRRRFSSRTATLVRLDRVLGVPLCIILTCVRRIAGYFQSAADRPAVSSLLFIKLAEQGSTVLAQHAIRTAVSRVGRDRVYFMVFEENRFILDLMDLIPPGNVLAVRTGSIWQMAVSGVRIIRYVRRRRLSACVDLEFFSRLSAVIAYLSGARLRVGFHCKFEEGPYRGSLLTHPIRYNSHWHTAAAFTSLVAALDTDPLALPAFDYAAPVIPPPEPFWPTADDRQAVQRLLLDLGLPENARLVILNANCSDLLPLRRWPRENYIALACALQRAFPELWLVLTGAPTEAQAVEALRDAICSPRCLCLAGHTSLRQLLTLYDFAEVLVTNDSGPAHFAALTGIDAVVLFGPETPELFAALSPRTHPVWGHLACSPCVSALNQRRSGCWDPVCMRRISVNEVLDLVTRIYLTRCSGRSVTALAPDPASDPSLVAQGLRIAPQRANA